MCMAPGLHVPFARGRGAKEGGRCFWVCACPVHVAVVCKGGGGGTDSHSHVGPQFACPMCTQMRAGGGAPLPFA